MRARAIGLLSCTLLAACTSASDPSNGAEPCARAAAHIGRCTGAAPTTPASCDAEAAAQIEATSCEQLTAILASEKADGPFGIFGALACAAGFAHYCPAVTCTAPTYPTPSAVCSDYIEISGCGGCQFYACREAEQACGTDGYYLEYGKKYCERLLLVVRPRLSAAGQAFLDQGRDCLMRTLDAQIGPELACSDVKRLALDSHVACYRDSGFCDLPLSDRVRLLLAVDLRDFDLKSALQTQLGCLAD